MANIDGYLEQAIELGINAFIQGASFVSEQVPLVIKEILVYNAVLSGIWLLISIGAIISANYFANKFIKPLAPWVDKADWYDMPESISRRYYSNSKLKEAIVFARVFQFATIGIFLIPLLIHLFILAKIIFAPRLYLLEYGSRLISG